MPLTAEMPRTVQDLTTDWLQAALSEQLNGAQIAGFDPTIIGVGEGFMGQLARVALTYDGERGEAPDSLIAKFAAEKPEAREMARDRNLYGREIGFYRDLAADVGVSIAECYYMEHHPETNSFVLLLEDLAPGEPCDQVVGADKETARWVIEQFATVHAKWWNSERLENLPWARWQITEMPMDKTLELFHDSVKEVEETGKFDNYPELKRLMPLLEPLLKFDPEPPYPYSLTHGDLRSDNIIRPSGDGGRYAVIDWQISGMGDPVSDIVYWITLSLTTEDRRAIEHELLKLYHDTLIANGVTNYSYKKFLNAYKTNLAVVQVMFSMSIEDVDKSSERAQALFHQFYSRLDASLVDWEMEKLLKVLPYMYPFIKAMLIVQKFMKGKKRGK